MNCGGNRTASVCSLCLRQVPGQCGGECHLLQSGLCVHVASRFYLGSGIQGSGEILGYTSHTSVAGIAQSYTISSNGLTQQKYPDILGTYSLTKARHQIFSQIFFIKISAGGAPERVGGVQPRHRQLRLLGGRGRRGHLQVPAAQHGLGLGGGACGGNTRGGRHPRRQPRPRPAREGQEPGAAAGRLELHCPGEIRPPALQRLHHRGRASGKWVHRVCKPSLALSFSLPPSDVLYSPQAASGPTGRWRRSAASSAGAATQPSPGGSSPATTVTPARTR